MSNSYFCTELFSSLDYEEERKPVGDLALGLSLNKKRGVLRVSLEVNTETQRNKLNHYVDIPLEQVKSMLAVLKEVEKA